MTPLSGLLHDGLFRATRAALVMVCIAACPAFAAGPLDESSPASPAEQLPWAREAGSVVHRLVPDGAGGLHLFGRLRTTAAAPWTSALRIRLGLVPPRVLPPVADATAGWRIPVFGLRNTRHVLERSPDLAAWTAVSTNHFIGSAGEFIQPTGSQTEFYRVRQVMQ